MNYYLVVFCLVLGLTVCLLHKRHKKMCDTYVKEIKIEDIEEETPKENDFGKVIQFPGPEERRKLRKLNAGKTKDP